MIHVANGAIAHLTLSEPPPSVNAIYVPLGHGKSILSKEARVWKELAGLELMTQRGICPDPSFWRCDVLIPGRAYGIDLPNFEKALTDALVKAGKSPDDRYLVDFRYRWHAGDDVKIAIKQEDLHKWAKILNVSKSTIRKLAKFSG